MKILFLLFIAAIIILAQGGSANGQCKCDGEQRADGKVSMFVDAMDELDHSDMVFVGEVLSFKKGAKHIPDYAILRYEEVEYKAVEYWKGIGGERIAIRMQTAGLKRGDRMLIFAKRIEGDYWTICCSRNGSVENAGDYLKLFREKGLKPVMPGHKKT